MKCEKCQDRGFTEQEHGLICVFCDCEKGIALREEITGQPTGGIDDSSSGTGQPDSGVGSADTSKPKRKRKQKKSKRA